MSSIKLNNPFNSPLDAKLSFHSEALNKQEVTNLNSFSQAEQEVIIKKRNTLAVLGGFIGKDFEMPVLVGAADGGWFYNPGANSITIDSKDLFTKPVEFLRFVICHEGAHRRITNMDLIPDDLKQNSDFMYLWNRLEDPRVNNYITESHPVMNLDMDTAYAVSFKELEDQREKSITENGYYPKTAEAVDRLTKIWFEERRGNKIDFINYDVKPEVQEFLTNISQHASDSWHTYPSIEETDNKELVKGYSKGAYDLVIEKIWPEFQKLIVEDRKDGYTSEVLKKLSEELKSGSSDIKEQLKEILSKEALKDLLQESSSLAEGKSNLKEALEKISDTVKGEIKEAIQKSEQERMKELKKEIEEALKKLIEEIVNLENPKLVEGEEGQPIYSKAHLPEDLQDLILRLRESPEQTKERITESDKFNDFREALESQLNPDKSVYEEYKSEMSETIRELEKELRAILHEKRKSHYETGKKSGSFIDISRRISEVAKGTETFDTKSFMKRHKPKVKDYAITLLIDLSGSMDSDNKIQESFKALIVLSEVLHKLSINFEVLGFNDKIIEYKRFGQSFSKLQREKMSETLDEVSSSSALYNDDGYALLQASARLQKQNKDRRFLIVLSDGMPAPSPKHSGAKYELAKVVGDIRATQSQQLIGVGLGNSTDHVKQYYPNSLVVDRADKLAGTFGDLLKYIILNGDKFKR